MVEALLERRGQDHAFSSQKHVAAFFARERDVVGNLVELSPRGDRSLSARRCQRISGPQLARLGHKVVAEPGIEAFLDEDSRARQAKLPLIQERGLQRGVERTRIVRVRKDHSGVLAAHLE